MQRCFLSVSSPLGRASDVEDLGMGFEPLKDPLRGLKTSQTLKLS